MRYVALRKSLHADQRFTRPSDYRFATQETFAPVAIFEAAQAAVSMPLAFLRVQGATHLVALLALHVGQNLFVAPTGSWMSQYVPAALRSFPFKLVRVEGQDKLAICIEENALGSGEPLYEPHGAISDAVQEDLRLLEMYEEGRQRMVNASASLFESGVLVPWDIKIEDSPDGALKIGGLLRVDERAIHALADDAFLRLKREGGLPLAYAQLISMQRLSLMGQLSSYHAGQKTNGSGLDFLYEDEGNIVF